MPDAFAFQRDLSGPRAYVGAHPVAHVREAVEDPTDLDPVTLVEAKAQLNITHDLDNAYITSLITDARETIEEVAGIALVTQTITATFRGPAAYADLPVEPVRSITSAVRTAYGGTQEHNVATLQTTGRRVSLINRTALAYGGDVLTMGYEAGYGTAAQVPGWIKRAILAWVADLYVHRTTFDAGSLAVAEFPGPVRAMISRLRRINA